MSRSTYEPGMKLGKLTLMFAMPRMAGTKFSSWMARCECGTEKPIQVSHFRAGRQTGIRGCNCPPDDYWDFWSSVLVGDECWEWNGAKMENGYGTFRGGKNKVLAHRYAHQTMNGPIPDGLLVLHGCDNRGCVRPDHLRAGTYEENTADMFSRGRDRHSLAKHVA